MLQIYIQQRFNPHANKTLTLVPETKPSNRLCHVGDTLVTNSIYIRHRHYMALLIYIRLLPNLNLVF